MPLSRRTRMLSGFAVANTILVLVAVLILSNRQAAPPIIQGVFMPTASVLQPFELIDHNEGRFSNSDLKGRWHLLSYGFTTCPDICPTTLSQLAVVATRLAAMGNTDLDVLFYSVDHRRDTTAQLATYLPYFHPAFIGLTHLDNPQNPHLAFEKSLGIAARLTPASMEENPDGANNYQVSHGVTLFLINPNGELQAIFEPDELAPGIHSFNPDKLLEDYLAIRRYLS